MKTILAIILIFSSCPSQAGDELPARWRYPTEEELTGDAINWRKDSPSKYTKVEADFNGDGNVDYAFLLKSTIHNGQGLLVKKSKGKNEYEWVVVDEIEWPEEYKNVPLDMGIDLEKPGVHPIYCESYEDNPNKKCSVEFQHPAIGYFKFASASSIIYWDKETQSFVRVWNGD